MSPYKIDSLTRIRWLCKVKGEIGNNNNKLKVQKGKKGKKEKASLR